MARRRLVDTAAGGARPESGAGASTVVKSGPGGGKSRNAGAANPNASFGAYMSYEKAVEMLDKDAFIDMNHQIEIFYQAIKEKEACGELSPLKAQVLRNAARRSARNDAYLNSIYQRMKDNPQFRRKMHEPSSGVALTTIEKACAAFEARLLTLMGEDEVHNAKLSAIKEKGKKPDINLVFDIPDLENTNKAAGGGAQ